MNNNQAMALIVVAYLLFVAVMTMLAVVFQ